MAPKKKKADPSAQPSTSKAPPSATSDAVGDAGISEDVSAAGGVAGAGSAITTSPAADTGAEGIGGEQLQQRVDGQAPQGMDGRLTPLTSPPPTDGRSHSNGARSRMSHRPPAVPAKGAGTTRVSPPKRADPTTAPGGAADPRAPSPRNPAAQVAAPPQHGRTTATAAGTFRSLAAVRSRSSTSMPSTTTEAMAWALLLLRFPPVAEQTDEWRATTQSLLGFAEAGGSGRTGPPRPPQVTMIARTAGQTEGVVPTMQSPPRQQVRAQQDQDPDDVSMASSDPRARPGQRQTLEDSRRGDARIVVGRSPPDRRV
nr:protein STU1-like [Aegilops tauschii subsp. strangulata]